MSTALDMFTAPDMSTVPDMSTTSNIFTVPSIFTLFFIVVIPSITTFPPTFNEPSVIVKSPLKSILPRELILLLISKLPLISTVDSNVTGFSVLTDCLLFT